MSLGGSSGEAFTLDLSRPDLLRAEAFVAGRWAGGAVGRAGRFEVCDPATTRSFAAVVDGGPELAREAAVAAVGAFQDWRWTTANTRAAILRRWFDLILANVEDLARLVSRETGKPLKEARGEVAYAAGFVEWFSEEIKRSDGEVLTTQVEGRQMLVLKEPVGVVAIVTPWNFPLAMVTRKLAPALAAGCTALVKPAEDTPLSALALAALAAEAGLPAGCLNVVPGSREATPGIVGVWLADARVRKLSFTGSTAVGKALARDAAATLKRVSMELGGDAPFIVFDDADLDVALDALLKAKFRNAGQACIAANRVMVQAGVYEAFAAKLAEAAARLRTGPPTRDADIGPLISRRARDKVERLVEAFVAGGARVLTGGLSCDGPGWFYPPTVLADVSAGADGSCEEIFGPVVVLQKFGTEAEVLQLANASDYGLAAYVCTRDMSRMWRMARRLETGMVGVNEGAISSEAAPFGGVKASGYGREGSRHGLADYQNLKYVCLGGLG